jgi:hypothetical protein
MELNIIEGLFKINDGIANFMTGSHSVIEELQEHIPITIEIPLNPKWEQFHEVEEEQTTEEDETKTVLLPTSDSDF